MVFKGYTYTDENDAVNAVEMVNAYYNIPANPGDITQTWVTYNYDPKNFYYILFDESLIPILGEPVEFEISEEEI
jgi:hypothetical protein